MSKRKIKQAKRKQFMHYTRADLLGCVPNGRQYRNMSLAGQAEGERQMEVKRQRMKEYSASAPIGMDKLEDYLRKQMDCPKQAAFREARLQMITDIVAKIDGAKGPTL